MQTDKLTPQERYNRSEKGKLTRQKYMRSDKGKLTHKRCCDRWLKDHPKYKTIKSREWAKKYPIRYKELKIKANKNFKKNHPDYFKTGKGKIARMRGMHKYRRDPLRRICSLLVRQLKRTDFIYEQCTLCGSIKNIQLHHPNYNLPWHFYFVCRKCHPSMDGDI